MPARPRTLGTRGVPAAGVVPGTPTPGFARPGRGGVTGGMEWGQGTVPKSLSTAASGEPAKDSGALGGGEATGGTGAGGGPAGTCGGSGDGAARGGGAAAGGWAAGTGARAAGNSRPTAERNRVWGSRRPADEDALTGRACLTTGVEAVARRTTKRRSVLTRWATSAVNLSISCSSRRSSENRNLPW